MADRCPCPDLPRRAADRAFRPRRFTGRLAIYTILIIWTIICLFPIYWTISTSFKAAPDVMRGHIVPWLDFTPKWLGWRSLGLSPTLSARSPRCATSPQALHQLRDRRAVVFRPRRRPGSCAAYGLSRFSYKSAPCATPTSLFFFLSQLILPPVVLALPFLVVYKDLALLDTRIGLIMLYTLTVLPIVIWIMRDQFSSIPVELEEAALVDGLSIWGAFLTIVLPIALPGMVAAFILSLVLTWNEYFFAALLTGTNAVTIPVMVASQTGSQGISWWSMAALSFGAIVPLIIIGIVLERYIIKGMAAGAVK